MVELAIPKPMFVLNKVRTFWEAHKIWKNLPHGLDVYYVSKRPKHGEDFANSCVLLKYKL